MQHTHLGEGMLLEQTSQFFDPGEEPFLGMLSGGGTLGEVRSEADIALPLRNPAARQQSLPQPRPSSGRRGGGGGPQYQPQGGVPALMPRKGTHGSLAATMPASRSGAGVRDQRAAIELASLLGIGAISGGGMPDRSALPPERYRGVGGDGVPPHMQQQQQPLPPGHLASHMQRQRSSSPIRQATLVPVSETLPRQPSPRQLSPRPVSPVPRSVTYQHHPPPQLSPRGHTGANGGSPAASGAAPRGGGQVGGDRPADGFAPSGRASAGAYAPWERTGGGGGAGGGHGGGGYGGGGGGSISRELSRRASVGPHGAIGAEYSSRRVSYTNELARRASVGAHPSVDLGSPVHSSGPVVQRQEPWDSPAHAQSDRLLRRLEEANCELQDRLVAAHASHADAQAQVAALEAAHRSLEAQLYDLREKMRAGEPALEAAHRQLDSKAAEAKRALDAAAEAEKVREQLETEVAGLKEAVADLKRELEAANRKVLVEADSARRADGEAQALRRDVASAGEALEKARAEGNELREKLRAAEGEAMRRSAAAELEAERVGQQLREARERCTAAEARAGEMQQQLTSAQMELVFLRRELDAARVDAHSSRAASMAAASAAAAAQQQMSVLRASTPAYAPPPLPPIAVGGPWSGGSGYVFMGSPTHRQFAYPGMGGFDSPAPILEAVPSSSSVFREASQAQLWPQPPAQQQQQQPQQQQNQPPQQGQQQQQQQQQTPALGGERSWYGSPGPSGMQQGPPSPGPPSVSPGRPGTATTAGPGSPTRVDHWAQARPWEAAAAAAAVPGIAPATGASPAAHTSVSFALPGLAQQGAAAPQGGFGGQPGPQHEAAPFGTEMSVQELMARTKATEDDLLRFCQERDELESELSRMPLGGGRTIRQRQRKEFIETRLDELRSQISGARMQIKRMGGK